MNNNKNPSYLNTIAFPELFENGVSGKDMQKALHCFIKIIEYMQGGKYKKNEHIKNEEILGFIVRLLNTDCIYLNS